MISSFFRNLLIARKHSLCIAKSRESIVLSQYICARSVSRAFNDDNIITKPDKSSGVVLLNKSDCVDKMNEILDD